MSKNAEPTPQGGVHSVQNWNRRGGNHADWGRPELESYTPVNIGNGPYRDNGEGVAATPLPYPLTTKDTKDTKGGTIRAGGWQEDDCHERSHRPQKKREH